MTCIHDNLKYYVQTDKVVCENCGQSFEERYIPIQPYIQPWFPQDGTGGPVMPLSNPTWCGNTHVCNSRCTH